MNSTCPKPTLTALTRWKPGWPIARTCRARVHQILDTLDQSVKDGCDAHAAEDRVIEQLRQLGQEVLTHWAVESQAQLQQQVPAHHPGAIRHGKKRLT